MAVVGIGPSEPESRLHPEFGAADRAVHEVGRGRPVDPTADRLDASQRPIANLVAKPNGKALPEHWSAIPETMIVPPKGEAALVADGKQQDPSLMSTELAMDTIVSVIERLSNLKENGDAFKLGKWRWDDVARE